MSTSLNELARQATQAASAGRWQEAESLWKKVLRRAPAHPQALSSLGIHALQKGDVQGGIKRLESARKAAPDDLFVLMTLCDVYRQTGASDAERDVIDAALAVDAYFAPALLAKGAWFERAGQASLAATTYANALKISPPEAEWPEAYRTQLAQAKRVSEGFARKFRGYLSDALAEKIDALPPALAERWHEAVSLRARCSQPYVSESNQLHVPRLPAIPFYDPADFPFFRDLEAKTDVIREELLAALEQDREKFSPYIAYNPGEPVNQWAELNHSDRWSTLQLWRYGEPLQENLGRCPETAKALREASLATIDGVCPNALFSALAPHTHIPPHNGESNARLVAHLPLIIPEKCSIRVGFETREWKVGEILVFDDTLEHEARNDSDELRVVLIFDVWNPLLTTEERDIVNRMASASRQYDG
jgi:aspartyl/asparaginyl beta-hydroxylase (cupin superfamily)/Tfp pilus assembly protein PilF